MSSLAPGQAAACLQARTRGFLARRHLVHQPREEFAALAGMVANELGATWASPFPSYPKNASNRVARPCFGDEGGIVSTRAAPASDAICNPIALSPSNAIGDAIASLPRGGVVGRTLDLGSLTASLEKDLLGLDVRSTAELQAELRFVREQLDARAQVQPLRAGDLVPAAAAAAVPAAAAPAAAAPAGGGAAAELMGLWSGACEVMFVTGEGPVYLAPASGALLSTVSSACHLELPREHFGRRTRIFALTAFNPLGKVRTLVENRAANCKLHEAILALDPAPSAVWCSFGFSLAEGWREDGFCLQYLDIVDSFDEDSGTSGSGGVGGGGNDTDDDDSALSMALKVVMGLASRFDQGAIYAYTAVAGGLLRTTVPCAGFDSSPETVMVVRVCQPTRGGLDTKQLELLDRPWAGPTWFNPI